MNRLIYYPDPAYRYLTREARTDKWIKEGCIANNIVNNMLHRLFLFCFLLT